MHELSHIIIWWKSEINNIDFRDINSGYTYNEDEVFCNKLAAEILVPKKLLIEKNKKINDYSIDKKVKILSKDFWVSSEVIFRRLFDLNIIERQKYIEFRNRTEEWVKKKSSGFVEYHIKVLNTNWKLFTRMVFNALYEGKISIGNVSSLLNLNIKHIKKLEDVAFS